MSRFDGMVAIVTGAGAGIGRACAVRLESDGAKVVVCDINENAANETKETIENAGGVATIEIFDLLDSEAIFRTAKNTKEKFDIVLLDPPYAEVFLENSLKMITEIDILQSSGIIVAESPVGKSLEGEFLQHFQTKTYKYGNTMLMVCRKN